MEKYSQLCINLKTFAKFFCGNTVYKKWISQKQCKGKYDPKENDIGKAKDYISGPS